MKTITRPSTICMILLLMLFTPMKGQELSTEALENAPYFFSKQFSKQTLPIGYIKKSPGHLSKSNWNAIIDSTWGPGLPVDEKLEIFDLFWQTIDAEFACFQDLIVNWNSLDSLYRSEIEDTVSRGRFAAIMNHLAMALKESHTNCEDKSVCNYTSSAPGVPLLWVGAWGDNGHFGAGLTPLADSSLLVYKAIADHPLGLVPGDIVLGYDGVPWKILYQDLLAAQLPIHGWWWGSSESSYLHSWLISCGLNWHLFDTIDIYKYGSGNTIHLSTSPLAELDTVFFCTEQMDVSGVPMPDYYNEQLFNYGIIDGTQIAYIYSWGWFWDAEDEFYNAVDDIMNNYETTGLIIDFRMNYGGNMFLSNPGLSLLFNTIDTTIGVARRSDPNNHFAMAPYTPPSAYIIPGDSLIYYDKPIAVLTGPGAISSGDQVALRMKFHPRSRFFGKSTATAFNGPTVLDLGKGAWYCRYARGDAYLVTEPENYLTHDEFEVDVDVWHNPDDVALEIDAVVQAAVSWIDSIVVDISESNRALPMINILKCYPNPFSTSTTIEYIRTKQGNTYITIFNHLGKIVERVELGISQVGKQQYLWYSSDLPNGIYFVQVRAGQEVATRKIVKMR
ncbi:MAG: T9SS type A sorting domain-containing protein [Bacteroidetes bacterium]|nr:T9SS type A sorting domain-containing protein [Bacteroidota bacterium]MBL6943164.1 T9SS type A sorting domain-containing protein [Bacteroidales bacterium]